MLDQLQESGAKVRHGCVRVTSQVSPAGLEAGCLGVILGSGEGGEDQNRPGSEEVAELHGETETRQGTRLEGGWLFQLK